MSNNRTVLVDEISYLGTDGEDHVAHKGDKIVVAAAGIQHFDWVHEATPEFKGAAALKAAEEASKPKSAAKSDKAADS